MRRVYFTLPKSYYLVHFVLTEEKLDELESKDAADPLKSLFLDSLRNWWLAMKGPDGIPIKIDPPFVADWC